MRTPSYNLNTHDADNDAVVNRLKLLEDSVNAFIGNQCDHNKELFNKYETLVVSRTAETTKLDEIIKKLNTNELQDNRPINTPTNNDNVDRVFKIPNVDETAEISNVSTTRPVPAPSVRVSGNVLQNISLNTEQRPPYTPANDSHRLWTDVIKQGTKRKQTVFNVQTNPTNSTLPRRHWKDQLHLLHGTGGQGSQGPTFSADIDIVAYNVAKHITSVDLSNCLSGNGLSIKDCKLLTTSEEARSLSYKITISAGDFEKATKDVSIWPYRVGVRLFKHFSNAKTTNQNAHKDKKHFIKEDRYPKQQAETQRLKIRNQATSGDPGNYISPRVSAHENRGSFVNPIVLSRGNTGNSGNEFNTDTYSNGKRSVWLRPKSHSN